jgi:hypothetical protein
MNGYDILQNAGICKDVANLVVDYLQDDAKACKDLHKDRLYFVHSQMDRSYLGNYTPSLSYLYEYSIFDALERNTKYIQSCYYFSDDEFDSQIKQELITINEIINGNVYLKLKFDRLQKRLEQFERVFPDIFEHDTFTPKEITHLKKLFRCKLPSVKDRGYNQCYYCDGNYQCYYCDSNSRCEECDERNGYGITIILKPYDLAFFIHRLRNRNMTHRLYDNSHINGRKIFDTLEDFPDTDIQCAKTRYHNEFHKYFRDLEIRRQSKKREEDLKKCTAFQDGWEHTYNVFRGPRSNAAGVGREMRNITVRVIKRTAKMLHFTVGIRDTVYRKKIYVDKLRNNIEGEYVKWFREKISTFDVVDRYLQRE